MGVYYIDDGYWYCRGLVEVIGLKFVFFLEKIVLEDLVFFVKSLVYFVLNILILFIVVGDSRV